MKKTLLLLLACLALVSVAAQTFVPSFIPGIVSTTSYKNYENIVYGYKLSIPFEAVAVSDDELNAAVKSVSGTKEPLYDYRVWLSDNYTIEFELKKPTNSSFEDEVNSKVSFKNLLLEGPDANKILSIEDGEENGKVFEFKSKKMLEYSVVYTSLENGKEINITDVYYDYYGNFDVEYIIRIYSNALTYNEAKKILNYMAESFECSDIKIRNLNKY